MRADADLPETYTWIEGAATPSGWSLMAGGKVEQPEAVGSGPTLSEALSALLRDAGRSADPAPPPEPVT